MIKKWTECDKHKIMCDIHGPYGHYMHCNEEFIYDVHVVCECKKKDCNDKKNDDSTMLIG